MVQQRKLTSGKRGDWKRMRGGRGGRGEKLREKEKSLWARSSVASLFLAGTISASFCTLKYHQIMNPPGLVIDFARILILMIGFFISGPWL